MTEPESNQRSSSSLSSPRRSHHHHHQPHHQQQHQQHHWQSRSNNNNNNNNNNAHSLEPFLNDRHRGGPTAVETGDAPAQLFQLVPGFVCSFAYTVQCNATLSHARKNHTHTSTVQKGRVLQQRNQPTNQPTNQRTHFNRKFVSAIVASVLPSFNPVVTSCKSCWNRL